MKKEWPLLIISYLYYESLFSPVSPKKKKMYCLRVDFWNHLLKDRFKTIEQRVGGNRRVQSVNLRSFTW